jgi:hypothetical protein
METELSAAAQGLHGEVIMSPAKCVHGSIIEIAANRRLTCRSRNYTLGLQQGLRNVEQRIEVA